MTSGNVKYVCVVRIFARKKRLHCYQKRDKNSNGSQPEQSELRRILLEDITTMEIGHKNARVIFNRSCNGKSFFEINCS